MTNIIQPPDIADVKFNGQIHIYFENNAEKDQNGNRPKIEFNSYSIINVARFGCDSQNFLAHYDWGHSEDRYSKFYLRNIKKIIEIPTTVVINVETFNKDVKLVAADPRDITVIVEFLRSAYETRMTRMENLLYLTEENLGFGNSPVKPTTEKASQDIINNILALH
ncbi:MAG: hypothetical protein WC464_04945 [Bdellovibrionales bacterium]